MRPFLPFCHKFEFSVIRNSAWRLRSSLIIELCRHGLHLTSLCSRKNLKLLVSFCYYFVNFPRLSPFALAFAILDSAWILLICMLFECIIFLLVFDLLVTHIPAKLLLLLSFTTRSSVPDRRSGSVFSNVVVNHLFSVIPVKFVACRPNVLHI